MMDIEETIDYARDWIASVEGSGAPGATCDEGIATRFAEALVQLADRCVIGLPCEKHCGAVHGQEAEELRQGIEQVLRDHPAGDNPIDAHVMRAALQRLLDEVDARDSVAYVEEKDRRLRRLQLVVDAVTDADIAALPAEVREARLAYQFPPSDPDGADEASRSDAE